MRYRDATHQDLLPIVELGLEALSQTEYRDIPVDLAKSKQFILFCISSPTQFVQVAEREGRIEGVLLSFSDEIWFSRKHQSSDMLFYVRPGARGATGYVLARRYQRWAESQKRIHMYGMTNSFGGSGIVRTDKFMAKLGMTCVGSLFLKAKTT
jgi:hypothetical protein